MSKAKDHKIFNVFEINQYDFEFEQKSKLNLKWEIVWGGSFLTYKMKNVYYHKLKFLKSTSMGKF